ncbi:unnamed protein product [Amoebophrya sp. A120]|nr:unnamed protein product [Amoebophrya sp. A120]|eukprot:GSA120T00010275001.1
MISTSSIYRYKNDMLLRSVRPHLWPGSPVAPTTAAVRRSYFHTTATQSSAIKFARRGISSTSRSSSSSTASHSPSPHNTTTTTVVCPLQGIILREEVAYASFGENIRKIFAELQESVLQGLEHYRKPRVIFHCPVNGFVLQPRESWFQQLIKRYEILDQKAPFLTKCGMGAFCAFAGESVVQLQGITNFDTAAAASFDGPPTGGITTATSTTTTADHTAYPPAFLDQLNFRRLLGMPVVNVVYVGGFLQLWVRAMEHFFPTSTKPQWKPILLKTSLTTIFLNPLYVLVFLAGTTVLRLDDSCSDGAGGTTVTSSTMPSPASVPTRSFSDKLSDEGSSLFWAGFWSTPVIFTCKYYLVPERLHIPYLCLVNFLWSVFASNVVQARPKSTEGIIVDVVPTQQQNQNPATDAAACGAPSAEDHPSHTASPSRAVNIAGSA